MINNIVDITKTIANNSFNNYQYPWDIINNIKDIINTIDKSNYTEIKPNVWIGKNVKIDKSVNIIGPCIIDDFTEIKNNVKIKSGEGTIYSPYSLSYE